jgi:6-phosphogluconolactonase
MTAEKPNREVRILDDGATIAKYVAQRVVEIATKAVTEKGSFDIVLSGGSTPKTLYTLLVDDLALHSQFPWNKTHFFFGDERHVKPDDAESNYRMANEAMLSKAPLKPEQIFRIKGEYTEAAQAALEYEQVLMSHFKLSAGQFPRFDVVLLGMGPEGHTASLFPGTKALNETHRLVVHNWVGKVLMDRITLTAPAINSAANVIFMITGADKAPALAAVLEHVYEPDQLPAQLIQPANGDLLWLADTAAGSLLTRAVRD